MCHSLGSRLSQGENETHVLPGCNAPPPLLLSCMICSSTPKVEAIYSSETSDYFRTTPPYSPHDRTLQRARSS